MALAGVDEDDVAPRQAGQDRQVIPGQYETLHWGSWRLKADQTNLNK